VFLPTLFLSFAFLHNAKQIAVRVFQHGEVRGAFGLPWVPLGTQAEEPVHFTFGVRGVEIQVQPTPADFRVVPLLK
jgi:hypothetical protein